MPAHVPLFPSAPAIAIIDQNNVLTLTWTPYGNPVTGNNFDAYNHWDISTAINHGPIFTDVVPAPVGYTGGTPPPFVKILSAGIVSLSMQAFSSSDDTTWLTGIAPVVGLPGGWLTSGAAQTRDFPTALTIANITFSATSLLLGQTLTATLNNTYTGADQWQILWPDNTTTGWLPLATNVVTKSFSVPGPANIIVQTRRQYTAVQYAPPTQLISQVTQQVFVVDQQFTAAPTTQGGLTGDLGIGGQQGFEIVNATSGTVTPEPWEVIARAMVRDSVTNELKLLVATSRFSNASSLFGTMALDVFPIEGRPRGKELIVPPYELTVTSLTETVPVSITTTALPTLFVGKSVTEALGGPFAMTGANGILPYIWSSVGLPAGLTINASGVLNGTPLELGMFSVTIAVQDSSVPFSIAEQTFSLTIATDLEVIIAPSQFDANNTPLAQNGTTLGVAQVGTPYNVLMQVGNIDPAESGPGGLPPYTWSAPAGAFPTGLSIVTDPSNSLFGLISGTPATYNSTTDFNTTYSITIQVTDSIGAKATQTYTMTLKPEALSFGHVNQLTLYPDAKYKLVVPVFGGQSPYTFISGSDFTVPIADAGIYGTPALIDGQIEIPIIGALSLGTHSFQLRIVDNQLTVLGPVQFSYVVETEISDVRINSGYVVNWAHPTDGSWGLDDVSGAGQSVNVPFNVIGNLAGFAVSGTRLNLTAVFAAAHGSPLATDYTMASNPNFAAFVGQVFYVAGFSNAVNNGTFTCTAATAIKLTLNNQSLATSAQAAPTYTLTLTAAAAAVGGATIYTVSGSDYGNGANNALVGLNFAVTGFVNATNKGLSATITATSITSNVLTVTCVNSFSPGQIIFLQGTAESFLNGQLVTVATASGGLFTAAFTHANYANGSDTGTSISTFACTASTDVSITLANAAGVVETHAATAVTPLAKALSGISTPSGAMTLNVLPNGITVAVDPTNLTSGTTFGTGSPDVEWSGPPGPNVSTSAGASAIFSNAEQRVPLAFQSNFALTSVAANTPSAGNATYTGTITNGGANFYAGQSFIITGFTNAGNNNAATPYDTSAATLPLLCTASTATTLVFANASAVTESNTSASAITLAALDQYSRDYTSLSHDDPAPQTLTSVAASVGATAVYTGVIVGGAGNAFAGLPFTVFGFTNTVNNGYFTCTASSATTLTLANSAAVVETHAATVQGDIGNIVTNARPYIVGDVIGLNPRKPYYDSPDIPSFSAVNAWIATVQGGSSLPPGLSLDANTGLIYGTLTGTTGLPSVIQYADVSGAIHGTVTINWITYQSNFVMTDNVVDSQIVGNVYSGANAFTAPVSGSLVAASLAYGVLPNGLTVSTDGTNIVIAGTPTEAGFFDCWFQAQTLTQSSFAYHRISTIIPVEILAFVGWADVLSPTTIGPIQPFPLPNAIVSANYVDPVTGFPVALIAQYGDPPRTFQPSTPTLPYHGIALQATLSINAGQYTAFQIGGGPVTSFLPNPQTFTFNVIDSATNTASITTAFSSQLTALSITPASPLPTITAGQAYAPLVTLTGHNGIPAYNFTISPVSANPLPTGLNLTNASSTTATIQGTTIQTGYGTKIVTIRLTDSTSAYVDVPYTVTVVSALDLKSGIDFEDSTVTGSLGFIDTGSTPSITVRPNLSFYVVGTGVVSTSLAGLTVTTNNAGITGTPKTLAAGIAQIELTGAGFNIGAGTHSVSVTVVDSGVSHTASFSWTVYDDGTMALKASNAIPTRLTTPT